jgi:hypothetical protein
MNSILRVAYLFVNPFFDQFALPFGHAARPAP